MLMRFVRIAWMLVVSTIVATAVIAIAEMTGLNLMNLAE